MGFKISSAQHKQLDALLGDLLDCYKSGQFQKGEVVGALAHVLTAGIIDNETEVKAWLEDPAVIQRWKNGITAMR